MSSNKPRILSYGLAINEALHQMMESDPKVILMGQGVKSPWYVGNTATGLLERFGSRRVIDTPVSENAMTGAAVGASIAGTRTVVVHPRMDFMLYAIDPIVNEAANLHYMSAGALSVPVVFWGIVNRGGEQAAQHSQAFHATFAHIPGLKVVAPATPSDAKGLMISAIQDDNPVVFLDDRWLYSLSEEVPLEPYAVEIGKARIARPGTDVTVIASSYMVTEAMKAAEHCAGEGVDVEVIDLRTIKPLDTLAIVSSVRKTGRCLVVDGGWKSFGVSAELAAMVGEECYDALVAPVRRLALPDCPAPAARTLEKAFYVNSESISDRIKLLYQERTQRTKQDGIQSQVC